MKSIKILILCLLTSFGFAQKKLTKTSQSIKVNKDVVVDLNTSHVEIEIDTWNKDIVEVEAYIESDKLSKEELQKALKAWNLEIDASSDEVVISTQAGKGLAFFVDGDYDNLLRDLEFELANVPELPEVMFFPEMPDIPEMPDMPEFPELPELPDGINTIKFDYDKYQEEGEKYLAEWSKKYEEKGGKELQEAMEQWAKKFAESGYQEKMAKWGEEFGKKFEGKWAKEMEAWGEKFGKEYAKDMEKWGEKFGKEWAEKMEAWGERFGEEMERRAESIERDAERQAARVERQAEIEARSIERQAARAQRQAERQAQMVERQAAIAQRQAQRQAELAEKRAFILKEGLDSGNNSKVKKVIKLRIPKKAKLKMNVKHGEMKISSVLHNAQGNISHSFLLAEHIDGGETAINVSYSPVVINTWNLGTLNLNFVDKAQVKDAVNLVLNSKSSNIIVEKLSDTGIIDGSFGDLTISNLDGSFKNLNLILENSDALVNLPTGVDYDLYFKGNRSKLNNKPTSQKTIRNTENGNNANRTIMVNAKFSNVIMN